MDQKQIDFLIVGQGLAGTCLSFNLLQAGKKVMVIDAADPNSASHLSSGIINPITGRRLVKSWLIDTLRPFAIQFYQQMENHLNQKFLYPKSVIWPVKNMQELNDFAARQANPSTSHFFEGIYNTPYPSHSGISSQFAYAAIHAHMLDVPTLINTWRSYLQQQKLLITDQLQYHQIKLTSNGLSWKNIKTQYLIFCEGYRSMFNPYFNFLPFRGNKAEILSIKAPDVHISNHLIKGKVFVVPYPKKEKSVYWIGSTTDHHHINDTPSTKNKQVLIEKLQQTIHVPFSVINHQAGIRPTTKYRRPFVGTHPIHQQLGILGGLGTKGVTLGAYFAHQLKNHILQGQPIHEEVNIGRFF